MWALGIDCSCICNEVFLWSMNHFSYPVCDQHIQIVSRWHILQCILTVVVLQQIGHTPKHIWDWSLLEYSMFCSGTYVYSLVHYTSSQPASASTCVRWSFVMACSRRSWLSPWSKALHEAGGASSGGGTNKWSWALSFFSIPILLFFIIITIFRLFHHFLMIFVGLPLVDHWSQQGLG